MNILHITQALGASFPLSDSAFDSSSSDEELLSPRASRSHTSSTSSSSVPPAAAAFAGADATVQIASNTSKHPGSKRHHQHHSKRVGALNAGFTGAPDDLKWDTRMSDRSTAAVNVQAQYGLPPNIMFDLLADPTNHANIFDAIESADAELLEEEGPRRKWRLDYRAHWHFWKVAGVCENKLYMWTDREAGTVTFKLREPGFLRRYEGTWTITPPGGVPLAAYYTTPGSTPSSSTTSSSPASSRSASPARAGSGMNTWGLGAALQSAFDQLSPAGSQTGQRSPQAVLPMAVLDPQVLPPLGGAAVRAIARMQAEINASPLMRQLSGMQQQISQRLPSLPALPGRAAPAGDESAGAGQGRHQQEVVLPCSSLVLAETLTSPKISPPYPLNGLLKMQAKTQVEEMLQGLVAAAAAKARSQQAPAAGGRGRGRGRGRE